MRGVLQQLGVPLDEAGGSRPRQKLRVAQHILQEVDVGLHAPDVELLRRREEGMSIYSGSLVETMLMTAQSRCFNTAGDRMIVLL